MISIVPQWLEPYVLERVQFSHDGTIHEYVVVSHNLAHDKPDQVPSMFTVGRFGILAVSDNYPAPYRELGLIHELDEYSGKPLTETSCMDALKRELILAEARGLNVPAYVLFRLNFFSLLVAFYEKKTRNDDEDHILDRIHHGKAHLETLNRQESS